MTVKKCGIEADLEEITKEARAIEQTIQDEKIKARMNDLVDKLEWFAIELSDELLTWKMGDDW